ncbi:hypothetical protein L207DRAFT_577491 [Hyaloscypha variabilis F]|uniref:CorA-like transporter domain-containing protein n=1 Tax=Hyaloscypha variabilis (strain UAMH 11265 / GT02V1 / F) TaxID=1149755 RepID=A0A2J6S792_HYAVF|nr:hypothetical protein L207DRAFT_577491 [Hyaloscypha variabilis F]
MDSKPCSLSELDGTSLFSEVDEEFADTFCSNVEDSRLEITRFQSKANDINANGKDHSQCQSTCYFDELEDFAAEPDVCQVFNIYRRNSYSRLYITCGLFKQLLSTYSIFSGIWDFVLPFRFQLRDSGDVGNAPFTFRQIKSGPQEISTGGSFECAYGFRYAIRNQRDEEAKWNPDYDPWSIRQTAVYQQYQSSTNKMVFVLISASDPAKKNLEAAITHAQYQGKQLNAFELHRVLISSLQGNWRLYIRGLEEALKVQSDRVTLAEVQSAAQPMSRYPDLDLSFLDRQRTKRIEDKILDLQVMLDSLLDTLSKLRRQWAKNCLCNSPADCACALLIEELEEQMSETRLQMKRAEILHKRVQGITQILSDLLQYENANSLSGLMEETKNEHGKVRILTEKSTRDAAAVKILTIITLIYLPVTVVADFFSTQLIHVDDSGSVSIAKDAWWFAVVAIPLTVATFLAWQYWLHSSNANQDIQHDSKLIHEKRTNHKLLWPRLKLRECVKLSRWQISRLQNRQQSGTQV